MQFDDLGLSPETLKAVSDTGYTTPTPIQEQAIPVALAGRDVLGIAQTGTGKTAAFTLPMIDRLAAGRSKARMPRALVIAPTRELADQVSASFEKYAKYQKLSWALLIGGVSFEDQIKKLDRGVDVLIATPGRLLDHFERGRLLLTGVQMMVVDEADRMLDMGFIPDLERIFKMTPAAKQTLFFSATMPPEITRLTSQFLRDPTRIEVSRQATTGENISQYVAKIPLGDPKAKRMTLRALIERSEVTNGIVFCNRKSEVDIVAKSLKVHGMDAAPIHGDLDQALRTKTLESFRKGDLKLLVASDVAARGLDIPAVSHVFNYDVPHHSEDYVHRIGRTGRAGRLGETFMIVTPNDVKNYEKVIKLTKKEPQEVTVELDWAEAKAAGERDNERRKARGGDRDRDRDRGRSREGRTGDRRPRPVADHGERASMAPAEVDPSTFAPRDETAAPVTSATEAPRPRRERRPRRPRTEVVETAQTDDEIEAAPAPRRERAPRRSRDRESTPIVAADLDREALEVEAALPPRREPPLRPEPRPEARFDRPLTRSEPRPRSDDRQDNDRSVIGFGHDTPAFLMRAPPAMKKSTAMADD